MFSFRISLKFVKAKCCFLGWLGPKGGVEESDGIIIRKWWINFLPIMIIDYDWFGTNLGKLTFGCMNIRHC